MPNVFYNDRRFYRIFKIRYQFFGWFFFINVVSTILELHAPLIESFQPEKKIAENPWLTKAEKKSRKNIDFLISGKKTSGQEHTIFKYQRNLVNRRLKTAQKEFCKQFFKELPTSKEVENELDIANCLNRSLILQIVSIYNGQYVSAPNISRIEVREKFCFRTVTLKELYDAIDSLDNKSPGPGVFNAWAIRAAKFPI